MNRIALGPLREEDSEQLYAWINDRDLVTLSAPFKPVSRAAHSRWFQRVRHSDDVEIFGIRRSSDDVLVGSCQLLNIDRDRGAAELQIRIGAKAGRDRGFGTEAVRQLLDLAFGELDLRRVSLDVFASNARAIRVYEKCGFKREGLLREAAEIDGRLTDVVVMGILRDEYIARNSP